MPKNPKNVCPSHNNGEFAYEPKIDCLRTLQEQSKILRSKVRFKNAFLRSHVGCVITY